MKKVLVVLEKICGIVQRILERYIHEMHLNIILKKYTIPLIVFVVVTWIRISNYDFFIKNRIKKTNYQQEKCCVV